MTSFLNNLDIKFDNFSKIIYSKPLYFGVLQLVELYIFIKLIYWDNIFNISVLYPLFTQITVLVLIFIYLLWFFYLYVKAADPASPTSQGVGEFNILFKGLAILAVLGMIILSIFAIVWLIHRFYYLFASNIFHYLVIFLLVVGALAIVYMLLKPYIKDSMVYELFMFIPCMLVMLVKHINYQFKITTKPIWTLVGIETVLIGAWILVPKLLRFFTKFSGEIQLLKDPVYLRTPLTLGSFENLHQPNISGGLNYKYHYAISAWFYINPQPPSTGPSYTKYTSILNYGKKPILQYNALLNSLRVVYRIADADASVAASADTEADADASSTEIYETKDIIYQKWNNIVINYDGGTMDVFLNGELVGSAPNVVSYMRYETVEVGAANGIQGGICNVVYYNNIVPKSKIVSAYRILRNKKVPVL